MRHWINPLLLTGLLFLIVAVFVLERRISGLERQLQAARSEIAAVQPVVHQTGVVGESPAEGSSLSADHAPVITLAPTDRANLAQQQQMLLQWTQQGLPSTVNVPLTAITPPLTQSPRLERQPSGVINGIPYYYIPLSLAEH